MIPVQESLLLFYHYVQCTLSKRAPAGAQCSLAMVEFCKLTTAS